VDFVKASSQSGQGFLDYGDTPSFPGVYEASLIPVGNTLRGLDEIMKDNCTHFFNPIGGLHHARRNAAGGFCVFNDAAIAISKALSDKRIEVAYANIGEPGGSNRSINGRKEIDYESQKITHVAYVDIDCHHGDGVYYEFENDPRVIMADIHEDGRYLYPGTGDYKETGKGRALGTKLNIPLAPYSGDEDFIDAFDRAMEFLKRFKPLDLILLQCGADALDGDPLTHLQYSEKAHAYAAKKLHELAHAECNGRILAMGGGGYNPENVSAAWMAVIKELCSELQM
jgi:acetoin utilization protein AcuC